MDTQAIEIHSGNTELNRNVLKFGYGIIYKYEGTLFSFI